MAQNRAWWFVAALAATSIGGCSNGVIGACSFASGAACIDFIEQREGIPPAENCANLRGTYTESGSCPTSGRVGRCDVENMAGVARVTYYAPFTTSDAMSDCAGLEGGSFAGP